MMTLAKHRLYPAKMAGHALVILTNLAYAELGLHMPNHAAGRAQSLQTKYNQLPLPSTLMMGTET